MSIANQQIRVLDFTLAYADHGSGAPVVFLHGNPTSSYLWRHMVGALSARYRCLAPDLIGMGASDKLPNPGPDTYAYDTHRAFVDAWFDAVLPEGPVVLVVHDWGSLLGLDWARRHAERVRGVAYMEAILGALPTAALPPQARDFFRLIRSPAGEAMVLAQNLFLERMLSPEGITGALTEADRAAYRRPFSTPSERWPTLTFPRLLPYDGDPAAITALADGCRAWLASAPVPKLFIDAQPGRIVTDEMRALCRAFPNQREVSVPGLHYPQEDAPDAVTAALAAWLVDLSAREGAAP